MRVQEDVSLDPRIRAVEVEQVVIAAHEDVVDDLENRARSIAAGEVERVIVALDLAPEVARENAAPARLDAARAVDRLEAPRGGREETVLDDERCTIEREVLARGVAEAQVIEERGAVRDFNGGVRVSIEVRVGDAGLGRVRAAVDGEAAPGRGTGCRAEPNARDVGAFGEQAAAVRDDKIDTGTDIDRGAGLNRERRAGVHGEVRRDLIRAAGSGPNRVAGNRAGDGLRCAGVIPDVHRGAGELDAIGVDRLHDHAVDAGDERDGVRPARFPSRAHSLDAIDEYLAGIDGVRTAEERGRRRGGLEEATDSAERGADGEVGGDEREHDAAAVVREGLHRLDGDRGRAVAPAGEHLVEERVDLGRMEGGVAQPQHLREVNRDEHIVRQEAPEQRHVGRAASGVWRVEHEEERGRAGVVRGGGERPPGVALTEDGVEVMADGDEARIFDAAIHRIVITATVEHGGLTEVHQRAHREVTHPHFDVHICADHLDVVGDRVVCLREREGEIEHVRPVVLRAIGGLEVANVEIRGGVGAEVSQLRGMLPDRGAIYIPVAVVGIEILREVAIHRQHHDERSIARTTTATGFGQRRRIHAVDAVLDDARVGGRQAGLARHGGTHDLRVNVEAVEVDCRKSVPTIVVGDVHAVVGRRLRAGARAAHTHAAEVANLRAVAVHADEGVVRLGVTVAIARWEHGALAAGHDDAEGRHRVADRFVINLEERVGELADRAICFPRRGGPRAGVPADIGSQDVELDDGAVRHRRQHVTEDAVAREAVAVRAIIQHGGGEERAGRGGSVVAIEQGDGSHAVRRFVTDARGDGDRVGGLRDGREMRDVEEQRSDVGARCGISLTGRPATAGAGCPALTGSVTERGVDQFDGVSETIRRGEPTPARGAVVNKVMTEDVAGGRAGGRAGDRDVESAAADASDRKLAVVLRLIRA